MAKESVLGELHPHFALGVQGSEHVAAGEMEVVGHRSEDFALGSLPAARRTEK